MLKTFKVILISILVYYTDNIYTETKIEINNIPNAIQPIGLIPFKYKINDKIDEDIGKIIFSDLKNSGKFNTIDITEFLKKSQLSNNLLIYYYNKIGVNTIIYGRINQGIDNMYIVSYKLINTINGENYIVLKNQFKVSKDKIRYISHTISDEIFEKLVGIRGVFRTKIVFVTRKVNNRYPYELMISDYDGFNPIRVFRSSQPIMSPTWSPDGNRIAYVTFKNGKSLLMIQTLKNGEINCISNFPQHNGAPSFSPDGKKMAFVSSKTGSLNIYLIELDSFKIKQITFDRFNNTEPSWFPDNENIAYTSDQCGFPQIYKVNINNSISIRISWNETCNQKPVVSPNGKFLIIININNNNQNVAKLDLETGKMKVLTNTFLDESPSISPNSMMVIYNTTQKLNSILKLISIDGNTNKHLPLEDKYIKFPSWSPNVW